MAIKVLVVDDEPDVAVIFRQKFRRRIAASELEFLFAENGRLALEMLQGDPEISLVFTDIRMPSMDGLTFLKAIRGLERQVLLSVVVSAYDDMPNIREAMRQGAWDFVTKPIDLDDLERVLDQALGEVRGKLQAVSDALQLAQAEQEKALLLRSKDMQQEFFENVTHEFRTPLTLLLAPLESALGVCTEAEVIGYLEQAKRSGWLLLELVNDLLDVAKMDAKKLVPTLAPTNLTQLMQKLHNAFSPLAAQRNIEFSQEIAHEIFALTDGRLVGRIVLNLLSNAFKFTPTGGHIALALSLQADDFVIAVKDTGPGLTQFGNQLGDSRFLSSAPTSSPQFFSSGLGLSICKSLVESLGGRLQIVEQPGFSTCICVYIPWIQAQDSILEQGETQIGFWVSSEIAELKLQDFQVEQDAEKPMLVLAEDHPDMRRYLAQVLQDHYVVVATENGRAAWDKVQELIPDLVLSDWMMPELNGLDLLQYIRHNRDTHHIPVVLLTAKAEIESRLQGIGSGAEAYLAKPFHPEELKAVLGGLLAQRERLRERFRSEILHPDKLAHESMEDHFLSDVKRVMESHMMDEQFGVETMADALAMSRRTLVRKLTALTGQAPVKFIRMYRLERALQMLQDHSAPIWEIAVKTGFGSASYFTKCFKDHYGKSPREAVHQN